MRRLFQFRLRALFVVVTLAEIVALWWSHRLHCLDRAAFHQAEIIRCGEQQATEFDAYIVADEKAIKEELEAIRGTLREERYERWEDQTVELLMDQGFLVIPSGLPDSPSPSPDPKEPPKPAPQIVETKLKERPDFSAIYEAKRVALDREIALHTELADQYLRAIYRPWLRVDESVLQEAKTPPAAAGD